MSMRTTLKILLLIGIFINTSCEDLFDYSPYAIDFSDENRDINQRNIERLLNCKNDDTITIAFTGDTHRFFDETELFVSAVNKNPAIDFVIHVGDIADFGLPKQYLWGNSYLLKLNVPYFVVIGNHDLVGNGSQAYQEMFGDLNYSFIYTSIKFVYINTNSREFKFNGNVPDIKWLDNQLQPSIDFTKAVVIFHVPPTDSDFDASLKEAFQNSLAHYNNVLLTVHGHLHHHEIYKPFADSIPFVNVFGVEHLKYNSIKISNNQFEVETIEF
ncbi:MAG TPA: metallophosphoesterase [Marinilabiliales bacterium]|nr:metallophosphoesterase [Marinilabiliales bacterium]HAZ01159.1 metallophosphoesterase [Marinilabiliales bacterium]HBX83661.1 metallophosphoesterase [Marinilabiliales bacterium]HBY51837.1 metallophosphoesterase [Marinilabiliales bacterium]HCC29522.1 metallophosphoesterase [Marinilabiliales bacterium]